MTILLISHATAMNGAQRSLLELAIGLKEKGEDLLVLCPDEGPLSEALRKHQIAVTTKRLLRPQQNLSQFLLFTLLWLPTVLQLRKWLVQQKIVVVYNNTIDGLYGPFAAWLANIPCVWHIREVKPKRLLGRKVFTWLLRQLPACVIFNSMATMHAYSEAVPPHWQVIYNGIELPVEDMILPSRQEVITVGFAGQMVEHKRPDRFLYCLAMAKEFIPTLRGVMVGEGVLLNQMKLLASDLGIESEVEILGHVDSMREFYSRIDMLVLTSDYEPFGRVLVEAMAFGRPVIAARVDGVPEVVIDGVTGYMVSADDIEAYTNKIVLLAANSELRSCMAKAGREHVLTNFMLEAYLRRLIEILKQAGCCNERRKTST